MAPSSRADGAPSSQPPIAHLQELLGVSVDVASRLLADSDGDLQTAVAMHFATRNLAGPSSSNQPGSDRERLQRSLREMGFEITLSRAAYFLGQAGGSVEGAAELYLSVPSVDPAAGDHGPAPVRNNRERRTSQPRAAPQAAAPRAAQAQVQEANVAGGEPEEDDSTDVDSEDESSGRGSAGENADADENGSDADEPEGATSAEFEDQSDSEDVYEESEPEAAFASAEERYDAGMGLTGESWYGDSPRMPFTNICVAGVSL